MLTRELQALYDAFATGQPASLPALPLQYADFARWQRQRLQGERLKTTLRCWRQRLDGVPTVSSLPSDRPRPPGQTYRGASHSLTLSATLRQTLEALGQPEGATLFMTLLAAFKALLYRYSGQTTLVVGTPVSGRTHTELEGLIGSFINTLVLRTDVCGTETFQVLLQRVRHLLGHYRALLEAVAADPDQTIDAVPLLSDSERHQILVEWNATRVAHPTADDALQQGAAFAHHTPVLVAIERPVIGELRLIATKLGPADIARVRYLQAMVFKMLHHR